MSRIAIATALAALTALPAAAVATTAPATSATSAAATRGDGGEVRVSGVHLGQERDGVLTAAFTVRGGRAETAFRSGGVCVEIRDGDGMVVARRRVRVPHAPTALASAPDRQTVRIGRAGTVRARTGGTMRTSVTYSVHPKGPVSRAAIPCDGAGDPSPTVASSTARGVGTPNCGPLPVCLGWYQLRDNVLQVVAQPDGDLTFGFVAGQRQGFVIEPPVAFRGQQEVEFSGVWTGDGPCPDEGTPGQGAAEPAGFQIAVQLEGCDGMSGVYAPAG